MTSKRKSYSKFRDVVAKTRLQSLKSCRSSCKRKFVNFPRGIWILTIFENESILAARKAWRKNIKKKKLPSKGSFTFQNEAKGWIVTTIQSLNLSFPVCVPRKLVTIRRKRKSRNLRRDNSKWLELSERKSLLRGPKHARWRRGWGENTRRKMGAV